METVVLTFTDAFQIVKTVLQLKNIFHTVFVTLI